MNDWYERRDELEAEMIFDSCWGFVKLDRSVPGDGTKWYVASWLKGYTQGKTVVADHWSYEDSTIEPGDLTTRMPDDWAGAA